jgi:nicotinamidase-related amidase
VIDVQNGFIRPSTEQVVPRINDLVQTWTGFVGDVAFTRFVNTPDSQYQRLIGWKRLQGSPDTDIVSTLAPMTKSVIDKNFYSVFTSESFHELIQKKGWRVVAIYGIATDSCEKTAMECV